MLKQLCQLEHVVADKTCRFTCENDTDINIIKEALFQFQKFIGTVEDVAKQNEEVRKKVEEELQKQNEDLNPAESCVEPVKTPIPEEQPILEQQA